MSEGFKSTRQNRNFRLSNSRVVFFDLEFYVPEKNRKESGMQYDPDIDGNVLLGGTFYMAMSGADFRTGDQLIKKRLKSFWLWNFGNDEVKLVSKIHNYLLGAIEKVDKKSDGNLSPILCGIGITNSDIPALCCLFKKHLGLSESDIFQIQNRIRQIDLGVLAVTQIPTKSDILYPKTKDQLRRLSPGYPPMPSGTEVFKFYERKEYEKISNRVKSEIAFAYTCYTELVHRRAQ